MATKKPKKAQDQSTDQQVSEKETQANQTTKKETAAGNSQTESKNTEESSKNIERSEDSGVDKKSEGKAASGKGVSSKTKSDIENIAKKTFERYPVDVLYFTSDLQGFATPQDASHHANNLTEKTIFEVKKTDNGK